MTILSGCSILLVFTAHHLVGGFLSPNGVLRLWIMFVYDGIFFNYICRFFLEGYIEILLASLMNIQNLLYTTKGEVMSSIFAQVFGAILIFFPFMILALLLYQFPGKKIQSFDTRFSSLTQELRQKSRMSVLYHFFFTLRRLLTVLLTIQFRDYPVVQIMLYKLLSIANVIYIVSTKPFEEALLNRLEVFNELCISGVGYILFMFTDWVEGEGIQERAGWVMIGLIGTNFTVNVSIMGFGMYQKLKVVYQYREYFKALAREKIQRILKCKKGTKKQSINTNIQQIGVKVKQKKSYQVREFHINDDPSIMNFENSYHLPKQTQNDNLNQTRGVKLLNSVRPFQITQIYQQSQNRAQYDMGIVQQSIYNQEDQPKEKISRIQQRKTWLSNKKKYAEELQKLQNYQQ